MAKEGINIKDPTIPGLLKPLGYITGQFGKNHLGDLDEHLPRVPTTDEARRLCAIGGHFFLLKDPYQIKRCAFPGHRFYNLSYRREQAM